MATFNNGSYWYGKRYRANDPPPWMETETAEDRGYRLEREQKKREMRLVRSKFQIGEMVGCKEASRWTAMVIPIKDVDQYSNISSWVSEENRVALLRILTDSHGKPVCDYSSMWLDINEVDEFYIFELASAKAIDVTPASEYMDLFGMGDK